MKKNILRIGMFLLIFVALFQLKVFAVSPKVEVTTDKDNYNINEDVIVTLKFNTELLDGFSGMKTTDFILQYDSKKLLLTDASISKEFCVVSEDTSKENCNIITVSWRTEERIHLFDMSFTFKAIEKGNSNIKIKDINNCSAYVSYSSPGRTYICYRRYR